MTLEELNLELKKLVGEEVTVKRIVCDSLTIYFLGDARQESAVSIFIGSSWRYQQHGEIVVGSHDFHVANSGYPSAEDYRKTFERMCSLINALEGARLVDCEVDLETSDLFMEFSGDQVVRSFANSAFDTEAWAYRNRPRNLVVDVSPSGVRSEADNE
jgi:hypothetical protein